MSSHLRVACPECGKDYATKEGVRRHTILIHSRRYDAVNRTTVPFPTRETLEQAERQCRRAQMSAHRRRRCNRERARAAAAASTTEIVPVARHTDASCSTESISGDRFGEVREVDLADLKKEPLDVCCVLYHIFSLT